MVRHEAGRMARGGKQKVGLLLLAREQLLLGRSLLHLKLLEGALKV
jgi:hypothetical protein